MSDFIREVDEEYRRERFLSFLRRFQVPLILLVVLIVAGASAWRWSVDRHATQAEAANVRFRAADADARSGQTAPAEAGFAQLAANGPSGYALLSRLRDAEVMAARDPEGAAKALDAIASDEGTGTPALRDLARYRGALIRVDREDAKTFDAQYGRFALDGFTFHNSMRELLALAAMKRGDSAAARQYLEQILIDPLAPPALRNRAQAFNELINAGPATAVATAPGAPSVTPLAPAPGAPVAAPAADPSEIAPVETLPPTPAAPTPAAPTPAAPAPAQAAPAH